MKTDILIHNAFSKCSIFVKKNGPTILSIAASVGLVATSISVYKATMDSVEIIKEKEEEYDRPLEDAEVFSAVAPKYILPITLGAGTIACIVGANVLNKQQQASIASAYLLLDNTFKEYKRKVIELYGEDSDINVRNSIIKDKLTKINYKPSGDTRLFYEPRRGQYFESSMEDVLHAELHFNRNFILRGYAYLNEFYEFLGLDDTDDGYAVGWSAYAEYEYGYKWVDFDHRIVTLEDGLECIVIEMPFEPHLDFLEF